MKRHLAPLARLAAAISACLALPACASATTPAPLETVATAAAVEESAQDKARPALWKVADEDTTIYLFGTIHALPPGLTWFDGKVAEAFDSSQELVTEIAGEEPAAMQGMVMRKAMLPPGKSLRMLMNDDERGDYEAALSTLGIPAPVFDTFEPWYAAIGLSTLPLMRDGYAREHGVEQALDARAVEKKIPHTGLETAEFQLDLFDALPMDLQQRYLAEVVESMPTMKDDLAKMVIAWKSGNAEELARLMNTGEDDPALVEALLVSRNRTWAGWIGDRLERPGTVFLAVGAGHLAGIGSVQEQLAVRGITAARVQ